MPDVPSTQSVTVITPGNPSLNSTLQELWAHRELVGYLVKRDITVRYKQSLLGLGWTLAQPLATMLIFSAVFGLIARMPSQGVPYPIFVFSGLLPWTLFSVSLNRAGTSLVGSSSLITKVYFPRLAIPLAAALVPVVDFLVTLGLMFAMMIYYRVTPGPAIILLPGYVLLTFLLGLGLGLWFTALHVRYRDITILIPLILQIWLYLCPLAYPASLVPQKFRMLFDLNPLVPIIDGFRWALLNTPVPSGRPLLYTLVVTTSSLIIGVLYFQRAEGRMSDEI